MSASLAEEPTEHLFLYWNQKIFFPLLYHQRFFVMQSVIMTHNEAQSPHCSEQEVMFFCVINETNSATFPSQSV